MSKKLKLLVKKIKFSKVSKKQVYISSLLLVLVVILYFGKSLVFAAWVEGRPIFRLTVIKELENQGGSQVLGNLVNQSLIEQEAKKQNVKITIEKVDSEVSKIEDSLKGQGMDLDSALLTQGMTKDDLKDQIKVQLTVEDLLKDKVASSDGTIDQQKLSTEYQTWITELRTKAKVLYFVKY
ncbi:SurA N-terminal domain-containing protein [Patescibacteria group bacterium]